MRPAGEKSHALHSKWGIYHEDHFSDDWAQNLEKLGEFSTLEEFAAKHAWLADVSSYSVGHTQYVMRGAARPEWEAWPRGGVCTLTFSAPSAAELQSIWLQAQLCLITEAMEDCLVVGMACCLRPHRDVFLSVWTSGGSKPELVRATNLLKKALKLPPSTNVEYKTNAKSITQGSSHHRTERLSGNRKERRSTKSEKRNRIERLSKKSNKK